MESADSDAVEFVVNVFERTYRRGLAPATLAGIRSSNGRSSDRLVVLISNVADISDAVSRAERLLDEGHIDAFHIVDDLLDRALEIAALRREDLEPLLRYSASQLVAATLPGSPWFVYWDPEVQLAEPVDWISPALELLREDNQVMVANPSWELPDSQGRRPGVEREAIFERDGFKLGSGFSDQLFLASRAALSAPIYDQRCVARILYPAAHKAHVFEARVDAHMRHHGRLRATSLAASYVTDNSQGESSYRPQGVAETLRYVRNAATLRAMRISPWRPACLRDTWL